MEAIRRLDAQARRAEGAAAVTEEEFGRGVAREWGAKGELGGGRSGMVGGGGDWGCGFRGMSKA